MNLLLHVRITLDFTQQTKLGYIDDKSTWPVNPTRITIRRETRFTETRDWYQIRHDLSRTTLPIYTCSLAPGDRLLQYDVVHEDLPSRYRQTKYTSNLVAATSRHVLPIFVVMDTNVHTVRTTPRTATQRSQSILYFSDNQSITTIIISIKVLSVERVCVILFIALTRFVTE